MDRPLPRRVRAGVIAVVVVLALLAGGAAAAVQVGARALAVGGGFTATSAGGARTEWAGVEIGNDGPAPVVLRAVDPRLAENAEVLDARVIEPRSSGHLLLMGTPLPADLQAALARSRPAAGFPIPPGSRDRYQVVIAFRPRDPARGMVLGRIAITASVLGLDQGAVSDGVYRVRAPR